MSSLNILEIVDIEPLEALLLEGGRMKAVDFAQLQPYTQNQVSLFCHKHGIYQIVTTELLDFVRKEIGDMSAIELGAGNGCLGRSLCIPITDNRMQEWPEIKAYYQLTQQPPVQYADDIICIDGNDAINHFKPDVAIATWLTQKWKPWTPTGNAAGVDECLFKGRIKKYIHIGNEKTHGDKEILEKYPFKSYKFPWLISRSMAINQNIIYVFDCQ